MPTASNKACPLFAVMGCCKTSGGVFFLLMANKDDRWDQVKLLGDV